MKHQVSDCCQSSVTVCDVTITGYEHECDRCGGPCEVEMQIDPSGKVNRTGNTELSKNSMNSIADLKQQYSAGIERYFTLLEVLTIYPSPKIEAMLKETSANNRVLDRIISNHTKALAA